MRSAWQKYLDLNVPRYTSYPSALAFTTDIRADAFAKALSGVGLYEPLSLYIHIPFCKRLCYYCGCNMRVENNAERITAYTEYLCDEIAILGGKLAGRGLVSQVHFGGGTPNSLSARNLENILDAIENAFGLTDSTPIAMEIDPRLCGDFQAAQFARLGITRFSIGVQDFTPSVQSAINRVQPYEVVERCIADLRQAGIKDISLDVLFGLPNQTICTFSKTIKDVITLKPDRVSLFGYAHMPSRLRHQRLIDEHQMPPRSLRPLLAEMAADLLEGAGFDRIGFDHFAQPGTSIWQAARNRSLSRNFQGFTEDPAGVVIGAGVSAISSIHGMIAQNAKDLAAYRASVDAGGLATERGVVPSVADQDLGEWLKRLLCDMRANLPAYFETLGVTEPKHHDVFARLKPLIDDQIVSIEDQDIVIHPEATALARVVAAAFDPAVHVDGQKFASPAV